MKRLTKHLAILALVAAILVAPTLSLAGHMYNENDGDGMKIWKKFGRGFINGTTFWLELPLAWYHHFDKNDPFTAIFWGTAQGIVKSGDRLGGGAYEIVTFPIPSPRYYKPAMAPETLFDD